MPSFDIVSKVDGQNLDNAINNLKKEILNRFDFQGSKTEIDLDKKTNKLTLVTESEMKAEQIQDVLISKLMKQSIDPKCLDLGKETYASGNMVRKEIMIRDGIEKEFGKKIVKLIKDSKLKVEAQIQDQQVRVTGKKIDDLQAVIAMLRGASLEQALQYVNMRS